MMKTALSFKDDDNWKDTQQADIEATGLQPTNDMESAIFQTLAPGAYTAIVAGKDDLPGWRWWKFIGFLSQPPQSRGAARNSIDRLRLRSGEDLLEARVVGGAGR